MIPKKIHYVWLGKGEKSERAKHCLETWKKFLPDYEIKEWNEDNFDINYNNWTKHSYENKKYAFTSDVVRLYALYNEGGIYMDTDVEVYKPLDEFLNEENQMELNNCLSEIIEELGYISLDFNFITLESFNFLA